MTGKNFDAMSSQEKCDVITNAASELAHDFFYEQDREGLDLLVKKLEAELSVMRDCVDCLNFINTPRGDIFSKINLLIDLIGNNELAANAIENLEKVVERARNHLDEADVTPEGIAQGVRNIKQIMLCHLNEHATECNDEKTVRAAMKKQDRILSSMIPTPPEA